jgi:hypothetical protein
MTSRQMQMEFERVAQLADPALEVIQKLDSDTIFYFLNLSQERYIKTNFVDKEGLNSNKEWLQKRDDILKNIIKREILLNAVTGTILVAEPSTPIGGNTVGSPLFPSGTVPASSITITYDLGIRIPLPTDYYFYLRSNSKVTGTYLDLVTAKWVPNRVISHTDLEKVINSAYNSPILRQPCVLFEENSEAVIYKDAYTNIFNVDVTYVRRPKKLTLVVADADTETTTCELSELAHNEIVDLAVNIFIQEAKYRLKKG